MMGETTGISWCDSTFNPWIGCIKVSAGCAHCYAERETKRWGKDLWGSQAERQITSAGYWKQPLKWQAQAARTGGAWRVFCGSFCDVFEDHPAVEWTRVVLWGLIEQTPNLMWLLLTKRPENMRRFLPMRWLEGGAPDHVWLGVSAENQATYRERVSQLAAIPARIRFVSAEPLLGPIDLGRVGLRFDWIIIGGESGPQHRLMDIEWARDILRQCRETNIPAFMKQLGGWPDKRTDPSQWAEDLRVQEFPE